MIEKQGCQFTLAAFIISCIIISGKLFCCNNILGCQHNINQLIVLLIKTTSINRISLLANLFLVILNLQTVLILRCSGITKLLHGKGILGEGNNL